MPIVTGLNANVFRAVSGSLFSSPGNWSRGYVPTGSDVVIVSDNCTIDISRTIGTLVVRPGFTASINTGLTLQVNDVINVLGQLSCSGAPTINAISKTNVINDFSAGTSTFNYYRIGNQSIPGVTYYNVGMYYKGTRTATGNIIISGNLNYSSADTSNTSSVFELNQYDLSVLGFTSLTNRNHTISKSKPGRLLFTGQLGYGNPSSVLFTGNPTVEFRGGLVGDPDTNGAFLDSGAGTWIFSTNNQSIRTYGRGINADIYISGSITLSIPAGQTLGINKILTGTSGSSVLENSGSLYFYTANSVSTFMTTGSANLSSSANTVGFAGNYDLVIPNRFANLWSLYIAGTGTKTLGTSSYLPGSLTTAAGSTLELSGYNLIVSGSTSSNGILSKSGSGNITFFGNAYIPYVSLTGNPSVEFKNGANFSSAPSVNLGTGSKSFTTSSQLIRALYNNVSLYGSCSVGPGITLTTDGVFAGGFIVYGTLTGADSTSKIYNSQGYIYFANKNSFTVSPATYDFTSSINSGIGYIMSESITIPDTSYMNMYITGLGPKFLSGNTLISGSLYIIGTGTSAGLELGNYDLTVVGTMGMAYGGYISKTGPGTVTFGGTSADPVFYFTGHPTVIFKTKGRIGQFNAGTILGSGSYIFTADCNPLAGYNTTTFSGSVIISGSVSASFTGVFGGGFKFSGSVNGTSASSVFVAGVNSANNLGNSLYFSNPEAPMITGSLWANTLVPNDVQYDYVGPLTQSIQVPKDPTNPGYYNLYLTGSAKKLIGNISVKGILSTGSTTIDFNGFTLTNP